MSCDKKYHFQKILYVQVKNFWIFWKRYFYCENIRKTLNLNLFKIMSEQFSLDYSPTAWSLVIFGPLFIVNLLQTLKIMASLSFVGNLCMIGTVVFILQFLIRQPHQIVDLPYVTDVEGFMVACCSILYSYEGQALVGF